MLFDCRSAFDRLPEGIHNLRFPSTCKLIRRKNWIIFPTASDLRQVSHHSMILSSISFCDKYHIGSSSPSNHNSDRFKLCISSLTFGRQHFIRFAPQIPFVAPVDFFFRSTLLIRCIKCVTRSFDLRFALHLHLHLMSMDPTSSIGSPFSVGLFYFVSFVFSNAIE